MPCGAPICIGPPSSTSRRGYSGYCTGRRRKGDADWADRDEAFARWYAPLLIICNGFSHFTLLWAGIPSLIRFAELLVGRFTGSHSPKGGILDALSFVVLMSLQWGLFLYVVVRDRRARVRQAPAEQAAAEQATAEQATAEQAAAEQSTAQGALT